MIIVLEYFSDGDLCPEKWLALLHTRVTQLTSLQRARCALRMPSLSLLTRHSTLYMLYMLHKIIYMTAQILSHFASAVLCCCWISKEVLTYREVPSLLTIYLPTPSAAAGHSIWYRYSSSSKSYQLLADP